MQRRFYMLFVITALLLVFSLSITSAQDEPAAEPPAEIVEEPAAADTPIPELTNTPEPAPTGEPTPAPTEEIPAATQEPTEEATAQPTEIITDEPEAETAEEATDEPPAPAAAQPAFAPPMVRAPINLVVNTTDDTDGVCDVTHCSLREAINAANANIDPAADTITFDIAGTPPFVIQPTSPLPVIADSVLIDGTTQPGYVDAPVIVLDGSSVVLPPGFPDEAAVGLNFWGGSSTVRGLVVNNFAYGGIGFVGPVLPDGTTPNPYGGTGGNTVEGSYIGTNAAGNAAVPNLYGVTIYDSADNLIGGATASARNVISGNSNDGINIYGPLATGNRIEGNYIGTDASGTTALGNGNHGVKIELANSNTVGGVSVDTRNIIAASTGAGGSGHGVLLVSASGTVIRNNYIGTNAAGTAALGHAGNGIHLQGASDNSIYGNVSSGNTGSGIFVTAGSGGNFIEANILGLNAAGTTALGNGDSGLKLQGAGGNIIIANVASGNTPAGISVETTSGSVIISNSLGLATDGNTAVGNTAYGLYATNISDALIGGADTFTRNYISGNGNSGIYLQSATASIRNNYIGTNTAGNAAVGNVENGIYLENSGNVTIRENLISGNLMGIRAVSSSNNTVAGNYIGTDAAGLTAISNGFGIIVYGGSNNVFGGTDPADRNIVSGNALTGMCLNGHNLGEAHNNVIRGNYFGLNAAGAALGNGEAGLCVQSTHNTVVGGTAPGAANVISGNTGAGLEIATYDDTLTDTEMSVIGNIIGADPTGTLPLGNGEAGIRIIRAWGNRIGGTQPGESNIIAHNGLQGIVIISDDADVPGGTISDRNPILGNSIYDNGALGIDLGGDGVTANDPGDGDTGANNLQNYPVLTSATYNTDTLAILGSLDSTPDTTFRIEVFINDACDTSGHGEGQTLLSFAEITTDETGSADLNVSLPAGESVVGSFITTTATNLTTNNTSEFSACVQITADTPTPPAAPTDLTATAASATQIDLAWVDNATDETGYEVERSPDGVDWSPLVTLDAGSTSYSDTGLTCETEYFYRVRATGDGVNSDYSNTANATTEECLPVDPPAAPTDLTATAVSATQIDLAWVDNATDETGYEVERSPDGADWSPLVTLDADATSYSSTDLTCETEYFYRVRAVRDAEFSAYSNTDSATTQTCPPVDPPAAPTDLTATAVSATQIDLAWVDNATDETGYEVERSLDGVDWSPLVTLAADATSYSSTDLTCETEYFYRVRAVRDAEFSAYSNTDSATTFSCVVITLRNPRDGAATTSLRPRFTWARNTQAARYQFQLATDAAFNNIVQALETNNNRVVSFVVPRNSPLSFGTYYWRVNADSGSGNFLPASEVRSLIVTPRTPPRPRLEAPRNGSLFNTPETTFSWRAVTGQAEPYVYEIQISTDNRFRTIDITDVVDALEFTTTLPQDGRYFWRVRALNIYGAPGAWSARWNFRLDTIPPDAPVLRRPLDESSTFNPIFQWFRAPTANLYRIQLAESDDFAAPLVDTEVRGLRYRIPRTGPQLEIMTYFWRVQARDQAGNWGDWSEVFSFDFNIQRAPRDGSFSTNPRPRFTWVRYPGALSYQLEVATSPDFAPASIVIDYTTPNDRGTSYAVPRNEPLPLGIYYWRVNLNTPGGLEVSPFYWVFTVTPRPPAVPRLETPVNRAIITTDTPEFTWQAVTGAGEPYTYEIQISADNRFRTIEQTAIVSDTNYTADPLANGRWFWRVRVLNYLNVPGRWSGSRNFTVNAP